MRSGTIYMKKCNFKRIKKNLSVEMLLGAMSVMSVERPMNRTTNNLSTTEKRQCHFLIDNIESTANLIYINDSE